MTTRRILFVESYPHSLYGQQETLAALLARCQDADIAPIVAAPMNGPFLERLRTLGHEVVVVDQPARLGRYGGALYRDGHIARTHSVGDAVRYAVRLRRWLMQQQLDAVYCNDMRGILTFGLAARTLGLPVIIWDKLDKPHGILDSLQLPLVTRNLVISNAVVEKYPRWQRRWLENRIACVYNGIDVARYRQQACPSAALPAADGAVVIGIAGTVTPRKGHDLLIDAFLALPSCGLEVQLWVIGDALSAADRLFRDTLQERTRNAKVHWLGFRADMPAVLQRIDILASPSRHEGMGRVNIEAMAAGKPVIGAARTGIAEVVIDGETGIVVDPADRPALTQALLALAHDPKRRAKMGQAGRARVDSHFDIDRQMQVVLGEIKAVAKP